jgi:hypothetical protein
VVRGAPVGRILYLPLTEIGFLRISANPKFTGKAVLPAEALALLQRIKAMAEHEFWTDDLPVTVALGGGEGIVGRRQITDAYLLALARHRGGVMAALDRAVLLVARSDEALVELVGSV